MPETISHIKEITITPVDNIDDAGVLQQLEESTLECLGTDVLETGYDLRYNLRDLYFAHGVVQYNPHGKKVKIIFNQEQE